jgi:hypothetical protein
MDILGRILNAIGWQGGTIHQVEQEIIRLRKVEQKAIDRLKIRVEDGCGGDFCPFCFSSTIHKHGCVYFEVKDKLFK